MTEPCAPCKHLTDELSVDERLDYALKHHQEKRCQTCPFKWDWMVTVYGLKNTDGRATLSSARISWASFQYLLLFGRDRHPPCPGMPDDPEPMWWPINSPPPPRRQVSVFNGSGLSIYERVKMAVRVEDIAESLTRLYGNGKTLTGKCPFHNEKKGRSFVIWTDIQEWKCYGKCFMGGDVIHLIYECEKKGLQWAIPQTLEQLPRR